jgi:hypothetical protein
MNNKNLNIIESEVFDCGIKVTRIDVGSLMAGYVFAKIRKSKDDNKYYLDINHKPKLFDNNKSFNTVKEAKKYYLELLSIHYEIIHSILQDYNLKGDKK